MSLAMALWLIKAWLVVLTALVFALWFRRADDE